MSTVLRPSNNFTRLLRTLATSRGGRARMAAVTADLAIGDGIYSFSAASRILHRSNPAMSPRVVRSWAKRGVTYRAHHPAGGHGVLTFADLISLEVEGRLRRAGMTSQGVRRLEHQLRENFPDLDRPLARGIFYTKGSAVWARMAKDEDAPTFEVIGKRRDQCVMRPVLEPFCTEVTFDTADLRALRWDLNDWVVIDPEVQFGAPIVKGTRVTVATVASNLRAGTPEDVADWYGLTVEQVHGAQGYLSSVA